MAIPKYEEIMLPLLKFAADKREHSRQETVEAMRKAFSISDEDFAVLLPSGRQGLFDNRIAWAKFYIKKAGLVESTRRGYFKITPNGLEVLQKNPNKIDRDYLMQFSSFLDFMASIKKENQDVQPAASSPETPEEVFESAYQNLNQELSRELLELLKKSSPQFFEKLVIELLVSMGYGGSLKDAGQAIGRSGDEGIDGIIKEDRLGLDVIYVQAKRWQGTVGRPEIQKFAGALQGKRAKKGIFITTGTYSNDAEAFALNIDSKIILIDGEKLAYLMIENNVGVAPVASYELKRVDADYFLEE